MMYVVTITERAPTEPEKQDVNSYYVICESMQDALQLLDQKDINWTCWVNVNIAKVE